MVLPAPTSSRPQASSTRQLVAHATWLPSFGPDGPAVALWAEATSAYRAPDARPFVPDSHARAHPFAARSADLDHLLERLWRTARPGVKPRTAHASTSVTLWLPTAAAYPLASPEHVRDRWDDAYTPVALDAAVFALWRIPAILLDVESAATLLSALPYARGSEAMVAPDASEAMRIHFGGDLRYWAAAATFVLDLLVRQRFLPGATTQAGQVHSAGYGARALVASYWRAALGAREDATRFEQLADAMPDLCRAVASHAGEPTTLDGMPAARPLLESFLHAAVSARVAKWLSREGVSLRIQSPVSRLAEGQRPYRWYVEAAEAQRTLAARWLLGLHTPGRAISATIREAQILRDGAEQWTAEIVSPDRAPFRLCLRLKPPEENGTVERPTDEGATAETVTAQATTAEVAAHATWRLDYLLQDRDDPSLLVSLDELWQLQGSTALLLDRRFEHPHERVFAALGQAARLFPPILSSLRAPHPIGIDLTPAEAYAFLRDAVPLMEDAGLGVLVPAWWTRSRVKPTLRLRLRGPQKTSSGLMGLDALVAFDWKVALGGAELTREELEQLAALKEPLVRLRGSWIELPREQAQAALRFVQAHPDGSMTLPEALRTSLSGEMESEHEPGVAFDEVSADEWIGELLGRLGRADVPMDAEPPAGLDGTLRPYQLRGLAWLDYLTRYGLGACLADDMGLGKTLELLALVLRQKEAGLLKKPVLLVCPTSVVGNWRHETARFAPGLRLLVHHGSARVKRVRPEAFAAQVAEYDLVVTTYGLLPRDLDVLGATQWGAVVLDEAQNIKNAEARQSRAAAQAHGARPRSADRHARRESPLRALGHHGLPQPRLPWLAQALPPALRRADRAAARRRGHRAPPAARTPLHPTPPQDGSQRDLRSAGEDRDERILPPHPRAGHALRGGHARGATPVEEAAGDMERRGAVLATLTRLKQVCNHPAHLLGDGSSLAGRSGKLARLEELIEELLAEGDRALIFTQFTGMGDRLQPYLTERFGVEVLYLHGGTPQAKRESMVGRFQSDEGPPLFLLSLKAGGTGLNLMRATHVIHFDRWWNPAVENQATDRAFRIGQTRNVQVRKLVCSGTLEERIDAMIEQKRDLAEHVVGSGEGWLTELSSGELRELFSLRADALAD